MRKIIPYLLILVAVLAMVLALHYVRISDSMRDVYGVDYRLFFQPALHSSNPYDIKGFFNPFWLLPFAAITEVFGVYQVDVWVTMNICLFLFVYLKMKVPTWAILPLFFFSGAVWSCFVGNAEGLVALGLILPPPIGLIFLMMKPQIGMALLAYYMLDSVLHTAVDWRKFLKLIAPLAVVGVVSVLIYGLWFTHSALVMGMDHNSIHFFPYGLPMGIALIVAGVSRKNIGYALMAIPLTTPYMIFHTWSFPILGAVLVANAEWECVVAWHRARMRNLPVVVIN